VPLKVDAGLRRASGGEERHHCSRDGLFAQQDECIDEVVKAILRADAREVADRQRSVARTSRSTPWPVQVQPGQTTGIFARSTTSVARHESDVVAASARCDVHDCVVLGSSRGHVPIGFGQGRRGRGRLLAGVTRIGAARARRFNSGQHSREK